MSAQTGEEASASRHAVPRSRQQSGHPNSRVGGSCDGRSRPGHNNARGQGCHANGRQRHLACAHRRGQRGESEACFSSRAKAGLPRRFGRQRSGRGPPVPPPIPGKPWNDRRSVAAILATGKGRARRRGRHAEGRWPACGKEPASGGPGTPGDVRPAGRGVPGADRIALAPGGVSPAGPGRDCPEDRGAPRGRPAPPAEGA